MLRHCLTSLVLLVTLSLQASAADLSPLPNDQLTLAARKLRQKSFSESRNAALASPQGGMRELILGVSALQMEDWPEAARHLAAAADTYPLLADYALFFEARALCKLAKPGEALAPLQRLAKDFPGSPLLRPAQLLYADTLFEGKNYKDAYAAYQRFIEKFPSGADALSATYKSALCLEQMGDTTGSTATLRTIWLKYPASPFAAKAEEDLQRLASKGVRIEPYGTEELLRRASTLFDLKKYDAAAKAFHSLPLETLPLESAGKNLLKAGQALLKCRRYKEAEATFTSLLGKRPSRDVSDEATFWLAKTLDKSGRNEEAFAMFSKLSESTATSSLVDKSLLEAAYIRKEQKKGDEAVAILKRLLHSHPSSQLMQSVTWEIAWGSYQSGDMKTAANYFKNIASAAATREKALYWYGRALAASGDVPEAQKAFASLLAEYPFGFYAQSYRREVNLAGDEISFPTANLCEILPLPTGYERVKTLITLGLYDDARRELSLARKKQGTGKSSLAGLARLYLEMDDYHGAYVLLNERPQRFEKDNLYQWGICFPLVFRNHVAKLAADSRIPEGLVYSIIRAESSFSPTALSPAGAVGLMQLMPSTATIVASGGKGNVTAGSLTDPATNIRYGVRHLKDLLNLYNGDAVLAVAAYNAGAGNVNRWRKAFGELRRDEFIESIPFAETREYVKKVLSGAEIYTKLYKLDPSHSSPSAASSGAPRPAVPEREMTARSVSPILSTN